MLKARSHHHQMVALPFLSLPNWINKRCKSSGGCERMRDTIRRPPPMRRDKENFLFFTGASNYRRYCPLMEQKMSNGYLWKMPVF